MVFKKGHKINVGRKLSIKTRKKIGLKMKGRFFTDEWKDKLSISHKGNKQSNETKQKISKSTKNKKKPWLRDKKTWNFGIKAKSLSGNKNGQWKGGITSKNHKIRTSLEYKLWRKSVFERDNFTCQKYGILGGELNAHHINNFADFPELRTSIENGITLSKKAHKEFHKKYGQKNNTKEQLLEFLKK